MFCLFYLHLVFNSVESKNNTFKSSKKKVKLDLDLEVQYMVLNRFYQL